MSSQLLLPGVLPLVDRQRPFNWAVAELAEERLVAVRRCRFCSEAVG